jgi:hypothetical protein
VRKPGVAVRSFATQVRLPSGIADVFRENDGVMIGRARDVLPVSAQSDGAQENVVDLEHYRLFRLLEL